MVPAPKPDCRKSAFSGIQSRFQNAASVPFRQPSRWLLSPRPATRPQVQGRLPTPGEPRSISGEVSRFQTHTSRLHIHPNPERPAAARLPGEISPDSEESEELRKEQRGISHALKPRGCQTARTIRGRVPDGAAEAPTPRSW